MSENPENTAMNDTQRRWTEVAALQPDPMAAMAHEFVLRTHEHQEDMDKLLARNPSPELKTEYQLQSSLALTLNHHFRRFEYELASQLSASGAQRGFEAIMTWRKAHPAVEKENPLVECMAATLEEAKAMQFFERLQVRSFTKNLDQVLTSTPSSHSR